MKLEFSFLLDGKPNHNSRIYPRDTMIKAIDEKFATGIPITLGLDEFKDGGPYIGPIVGLVSAYTCSPEGRVIIDCNITDKRIEALITGDVGGVTLGPRGFGSVHNDSGDSIIEGDYVLESLDLMKSDHVYLGVED